MNPGPLCVAHLASQDATRIKRSQASTPAVAKQQRKSKQAAEKETEEAHIVREGTTKELLLGYSDLYIILFHAQMYLTEWLKH